MLKARTAVPATIAAAALVVAGVAAANQRSQTTQTAAASFSASTVSQSRTSTCTGGDGTYQDTTATYTGTATSSDPRLAGSVEIHARSVVNTTEQLGWLNGTLRIRNAAGPGSSASISGTISGGNVVGLVLGNASRDSAKLVATFASSFTQNSGFGSGQLGTGSAAGAGVLFSQGSCTTLRKVVGTFVSRVQLRPNEVVPPVHGLRASANGSITFDVTRDPTGAVISGNVVLYVNYDFSGAVTITALTLNQGARGANGPVVVDSAVGTVTDNDGHGNLTKVVTGVSPSLLSSILANPHGYYVTLSTSANPSGALRDQLETPERR